MATETSAALTSGDAPEKLILHAHRVIARVVIELTAPMSIGTGEPGDAADNALVLDANGLPTIPGTSLAGVLRSAWTADLPEADGLADDDDESDGKGDAFGYQRVAKGKEKPKAQRSLVRVSWAVIHDSMDRPVEALRQPGDLSADPVLEAAMAPIVRDHVRIGHRGAVDGDGKFARASVMKGHRFSVELEVSGERAEQRMHDLITLLGSPQTRLGARTRAGLGTFKLVRFETQAFDLNSPEGLKAWIERPLRFAEPLRNPAHLNAKTKTVEKSDEVVELTLRPTEPWQIGAGDGNGLPRAENQPIGKHAEHYAPDILPYTEQRIVWSGPDAEQEGELSAPQLVLPASAIKGALRHRTAFYLRQAAEDYSHIDMGEVAWAPKALQGITALFGDANDEAEDRGRVGVLFIDDVWLAVDKVLSTTHVSVDRFTGAPLSGHLFTDISVDDEAALAFTLRLESRVDRPALADAVVALNRAIRDLCTERLQLGAGAGRGYGYFQGESKQFTEGQP